MEDNPLRSRKTPSFTRRGFLQAAAAGAAGLSTPRLQAGAGPAEACPPEAVPAEAAEAEAALAKAIAKLRYLTPAEEFREFEREKPRIDQMPPEKLREVGLDRETWKLEVVPDPESSSRVERPLSKEQGTALDWTGLMKLAEEHAVSFVGVLSCTNMDGPLGVGLWEGVPLREAIWMARPAADVRRVHYHGYHHGDPKQRFNSSLTISRVLEDPPGELPVILCYKLNGKWLSIRSGGPVRLVVPEAYGNKWVKWLQRILLTNSYQANDTYASWNNDVESPLKTCARFIDPPARARAGEPLPIVGLAQVGQSGLGKVQYSVHPQEAPLPSGDPCLDKLEWREARLLPPPEDWGGGLPGGKLPQVPLQFDAASGKPRSWPLRHATVHWATVLSGLGPGKYHLRCRTIDANGIAQPLPRPLPRSGNNSIQQVPLVVET